MGYTFDTLPQRTHAELNVLQLGYIVRREREADAQNAAATGNTTTTERNKREHQQRIVGDVINDAS